MSLVEVNWTPSPRELRQFATIWFPAFFTLVAAMLFVHTGLVRPALIVWSSALLAALLLRILPKLRGFVFTVWMCAAYPVGWLLSHVVLLSVFGLVITPVGLIMRLLGRDSLTRTFDGSAKTYWQPCEQGSDKTRYLRQF